MARMRREEQRHVCACILNETVRGPAFGMNRGWIAGYVKGRKNGGARLAPKRSGRIPVKIEALIHGCRSGWLQSPSKRLHFAPAPMLKTADRHCPRELAAPPLVKI